jgi:uncharacterized protein
MAEKSVELIVRHYLHAAQAAGIHARRAVLFDSQARGQANEWSDIDVVVIAPELDGQTDRRWINMLWELRACTDSRIEPIACGEREWETDHARPIIEIARQEGIVIAA